ncbi:winged helix-turn-helix transcriptional regulator [Salisediminibacterium halotolerans]|uniref:DNA-binding transcriptional regulator, HxlR family n=1 Tax=Salisediminibacterium halotolerans TaxID=517425 RepID=A0A1H9UXA6_9BACI|nr:MULTISPECIES: helix-turn-helix domain-containing protein [Salisediminibacterium]RLJ69422.1 HxlR family transcriptional regulator [Actinophytocola xinjiangensis]RPE83952.1 HxlR family transcriptional regulator [Salisediminibacterium halotolerans]TWG32497.1 HxlR family transcriptional regulator [Salisediminibacterium halotolerans]SES14076.1 DNA-binding transcriptional regulator, HxlR family [Salisediminibacterium haloalkalitolerans]GEL07662.1 HxlR family transcriptional regulator [Salisedimin
MTKIDLCPKFESAFQLLGQRWNGLIIRVLLEHGAARFRHLSVNIPAMSDKMLVDRLKQLEDAGIVQRRVYPETPVRIEYELTEKGKSLEPALNEIQHWAEQWINE